MDFFYRYIYICDDEKIPRILEILIMVFKLKKWLSTLSIFYVLNEY